MELVLAAHLRGVQRDRRGNRRHRVDARRLRPADRERLVRAGCAWRRPLSGAADELGRRDPRNTVRPRVRHWLSEWPGRPRLPVSDVIPGHWKPALATGRNASPPMGDQARPATI